MKTTKKWSKMLLVGLLGIALTLGLTAAKEPSWGKKIDAPSEVEGVWKQQILDQNGKYSDIPNLDTRYTFNENIFEQTMNGIGVSAGWFRLVDNELQLLTTSYNVDQTRGKTTWNEAKLVLKTAKPTIIYIYSFKDDMLVLSIMGIPTYYKKIADSGKTHYHK
ncbi:MAG: hypothetical protein Ta2D_14090 [Rickettsiales bacterium]|nr:MAG: hypothetical protein Ta2D_14090 [Rickettsiales bacterium]